MGRLHSLRGCLLAWLHCLVMGFERMNWLFDHTEVITLIAALAMIVFIISTMILLAASKTIEASDLQGAPETLGDFPPFTQEEIERIRAVGQKDQQQIERNKNE